VLTAQHDRVAGRTVRYARLGRGPSIVLLHGYPDNLQVWSLVAPLLADRFDVIAIDWPGLGGSQAMAGGATPFHMADHAMALLDHWKIDRTALVGIDMGGQPALVAAARHPDRVSHVVVSGSLLQWDSPTSWEIALLRRFRFNAFALRGLPRPVFRRALATFLPAGHAIDPAVRDDFWQCFRQRAVRDFIVRMCAGYQGTLPSLPREYRRIRVPVLALWGEHDAHFPPVHAHLLKSQIEHATVHVVPDGTHWLPLQMPSAFASTVKAFVSA